MKIQLLLALLLICGAATAQTLKLKKGQKFIYEAINEVELNDQYKNVKYEYWQTSFKVTGQNKDAYILQVSPLLFLTKWGDDILDSTLPLEKQPEVFMAIAKKVISTSSYYVTLDGQRKIIKISGTPEIRATILSKLKEFKIPERNQKHEEFIEEYFTDNFFTKYASFFDLSHSPSDRIQKSGLIKSYAIDTTIKERSIYDGVPNSSPHIRKNYNLITSAAQPLMIAAKESLKYADYYLPVTKATRKIIELASDFNREKGSQTVQATVLKQLDSLDKGFAKDDYQYLGAKLRLLTLLNGGDYSEILNKVPYEYLPHENDIDNKLAHDLESGDFSNVKKAVELSFTKHKGREYYPLNMSNRSSSLHDNFGGLIFKMQSKDSILKAYKVITDIEELNIPIVNDMLKGLKTYVQARLATDQTELAKIANTHFNSVFDMAGRYRILIYDELIKKQIPDSIKLAYIDYTIDVNQKKIDQINSGSIENLPAYAFDGVLISKVVFKKNLADAYYRKSMLKKNEATSYLQMAADYLPTQQDIADNEYGLKSEYMFSPFMPYTDLFLASGGNAGMTEEAKLTKYVDMVIMEPERYVILKEKYAKAYPKGDFKSFFSKALKSKLPAVPKFSLNERSGKLVANKDQQNKFVFVDFWGTWCGACVGEIDKIEKIHQTNPAPEKLLVTTIACYDKIKNVDDFMAKEKYTYEVLMSDGKVEKDFKIKSYPTKLLLLPNGVYLTISFYSNYEDILNKYLKWEI